MSVLGVPACIGVNTDWEDLQNTASGGLAPHNKDLIRMGVTDLFDFLGFGAMGVTRPYDLIGSGDRLQNHSSRGPSSFKQDWKGCPP